MVVVLVVSGDGRIGRHVRSVLGSQGWWVTTASDREEALRATAAQEPGLVIVDCEVEGAAELVRKFGSQNGGPGVLLLEPPGDSDGAFHAFEAGADQILSKPPRPKQLVEAAERVLSIPHQSSGTLASGMGEKLSSEEIFGELLVELDGASAAPEPEAAVVQAGADDESPVGEVSVGDEEAGAAEVERTDAAEAEPVEAGPVESEAAEGAGEGQAERPDLAAAAVVAAGEVAAGEVEAEEVEAEEVDAEAAAAEETDEASAVGTAGPEFARPPDEVGTEAGSADGARLFDARLLAAEIDSEPVVEAGAPPGDVDSGAVEVGDAETASTSSALSSAPKPTEEAGPEESAIEEERPGSESDGETRFGQYRLDERIAVGGMAEVWRASMLGMEGFRKTVAIKKILPHLAENDEFVTMFIEEAKLAARLSHENLVDIYDLGKIEDSFFIAMEHVDGWDLRGVLNRLRQTSEPMPIGLSLLISAEVSRGLEYAHTRQDENGDSLGLVHRDVSPRNVLIGHDGRVRLCDFGVAKAVSSVIETQIGALKGKLQYMSPEQASGRAVDNRSDVYSLGSVLYEMITGRRLYQADNEISLLDAVRAGNFDDPRKHLPGLPQEVRKILLKALAKKPGARYESAGSLEHDLRALLRSLEPSPNEQTLGAFVRELFTERPEREGPDSAEISLASAGTVTLAGPEVGAGSLAGDGLAGRQAGRAVRFWLGVAAGLLAAGAVATLVKLLLS